MEFDGFGMLNRKILDILYNEREIAPTASPGKLERKNTFGGQPMVDERPHIVFWIFDAIDGGMNHS